MNHSSEVSFLRMAPDRRGFPTRYLWDRKISMLKWSRLKTSGKAYPGFPLRNSTSALVTFSSTQKCA